MTQRYQEYLRRPDLVICRHCSTRARLVLIPINEITDHNAWHNEDEALRLAELKDED